MPFEDAVLIGDKFWNIIGGPTTYTELLDIYREIGRNKTKNILENLTNGLV